MIERQRKALRSLSQFLHNFSSNIFTDSFTVQLTWILPAVFASKIHIYLGARRSMFLSVPYMYNPSFTSGFFLVSH